MEYSGAAFGFKSVCVSVCVRVCECRIEFIACIVGLDRMINLFRRFTHIHLIVHFVHESTNDISMRNVTAAPAAAAAAAAAITTRLAAYIRSYSFVFHCDS